MSFYKKFNDLGKYPFKLRGDNIIMNPNFSGLEFKNQFKVENNDARLLPPAKTNELDHNRFNNAYPQKIALKNCY